MREQSLKNSCWHHDLRVKFEHFGLSILLARLLDLGVFYEVQELSFL